MQKERVSQGEISEAKAKHIKENLLYTPIEASELLRVSVRTVYRLIDEGHIEAINHSGMAMKGTRITAVSMEKYIQNNKI